MGSIVINNTDRGEEINRKELELARFGGRVCLWTPGAARPYFVFGFGESPQEQEGVRKFVDEHLRRYDALRQWNEPFIEGNALRWLTIRTELGKRMRAMDASDGERWALMCAELDAIKEVSPGWYVVVAVELKAAHQRALAKLNEPSDATQESICN